MELFKKQTNIDFLGVRYVTAITSTLIIIACIVSFAVRGLNFGIDFTGGTLVEMGYSGPADLDHIRTVLDKSEFHGAVVQYFGSSQDVLIRLAPRKDMDNATISNRILDLLGGGKEKVEMRRVEFVGAQVGGELAEDGSLAMIYALAGILIYVAIRFQMRFALGAIAATVHDAIITIGFFSLSGMQFDLSVLAAVLAVIGYSLNDTIVVFDRVRESFHRMRGAAPVEVFNASINQTLSRTIMTSFATLLVVIALFFWGGKIIHGFSTALMVGIIVGTYSSIYVASPVTLGLGISREDMMPVKKEGVEQNRLP
jgi:preprotein translocase subunit SecF